MKIRITYLPEEQAEAAADIAIIRRRHPGAKLRTGDAHPPRRQQYLQIPPGDGLPLSPCDLCRHGPRSRDDGKPCAICPASCP